MAIVNVEVKPEIFTWVQDQVDIDSLHITIKNKFDKWVSGEKDPTFRQIEEFSRATHIPLGYFFLNEAPTEKIDLIEFRTIDSMELLKPSRDLIDTINEMENIQEWMKDYLIEADNETLTFVNSVKEDVPIEVVVESIRSMLSIPSEWYKENDDSWDAFKHIRKKLEMIGVIVMLNGVVGANTHRPLNINEFRAFTLVDEYAPLIFINSIDSSSAKLFSLIHEVAHIWYGENSLYNDKYGINDQKDIEKKCNAIAAEIILPNIDFKRSWNEIETEVLDEKLSIMNKEFNCGMTVVARRAFDNGFITRIQYNQQVDIAIRLFKKKMSNKKSGGDYYNTYLSRIDHRLLFAMNSSVYEGETGFTDVYRLTNTNRKTFDIMVQKASGIV